jgi:Tol biopolymer transport system component
LPNDVILWGATRNGVQQIWRIRSNGTDARLVGPGPNNNRQSISHDRRTIAYVHTSGTGTNAITSVRLVGTDGKHDHPLFATPPAQCPAAGRPAFSPSDKTLALLCQPDWPRRNRWAIYLVDMTGRILGSPRAVGVLGDPTFNREGTEIGYWRAQNGRGPATRVEEVNATGPPHPRALTGWFDNVEDPMFSPIDDSLVMRIGNCAANGCDIYVLRQGSAAPVRLTHNGITEVDPAWSPDSSQIAYSRGPEANADIWVMNSDGTDQHPLVRDAQPDVTPTWASR